MYIIVPFQDETKKRAIANMSSGMLNKKKYYKRRQLRANIIGVLGTFIYFSII